MPERVVLSPSASGIEWIISRDARWERLRRGVDRIDQSVVESHVAVAPGDGFGPGGEGFVRFALIENEQRTGQALRNLRKALPRLAD